MHNHQQPRSSSATTTNKHREMSPQNPHYSGKRTPPSQLSPQPQQHHHYQQQHTSVMWPHDEILSSLLAAASKQYTPIAPSPLNPTLCESDLILGRHIYQLRKTARPQVTRRPPEISPRLRFLKRKAYFEYQAHTQAHHNHQQKRAADGTGVVVIEEGGERCSSSAAECEAGREEQDDEYTPAAFIVESGSLLHVVRFDCARRHGLTADVEKQLGAMHPPLPRWQRQRMQFFLVLCLMSACLTLLMVVSLSLLKADRYHPV